MIETVQYIRCLMERASKRKESVSKAVKPFRGGVLFFHVTPDATGKHAAWGVWQYYYTPYLEHEGGEPDVLCPLDVPIKKRKDCYVNGPMRQGVFYNREFVDRRKIRWLKSYCEKKSLGIADLDGFNWSVLLATQPVVWSRGHYLYDRDSPKVICALDFEHQISMLAYDSREGRNTRNDRLGYASTIYELCPCESQRRAGKDVKLYDINGKRRCYHLADIKVKHLGEVIVVRGSRIDWDWGRGSEQGNEESPEETAVDNGESAVDETGIGNRESAVGNSPNPEPRPKRVDLLRFIPLDQFFRALSIRIPELPNSITDLEPLGIELGFEFLRDLHERYIEARRTFESYKLDIPIWHVYSGGSIARAVLHNLGIAPFRKQNPHISAAVLSKFRAADCGGRMCTLKTGKVIPAAHTISRSE